MFDLFWDRVEISESCWNWTGPTNDKGYGIVRCMGLIEKAHRLSYAISIGPIPDSQWVLHHCDNPRCVRPSHLFLGTVQDNVDDMWAKGRARIVGSPGTLNPQHKLSLSEVNALRIEYGEGNVTQRELGRKYGISQAQVGRIIRCENWQVSA